MVVQGTLSAAQIAMHSIFDADSVGARLTAAREGQSSRRPQSASEQGMAGVVS